MSDAFSLDIGERLFKVIDVTKKRKSLVAESGAYTNIGFNPYVTLAEEYIAKTSEVIKKLIADADIKATDVNIVIPDSYSYTRVFEMPLLTEKELISAIKYQADQFIPIPIDKVSLDIHKLDENKEEKTVKILLIAAPNNIINHVVKIVEASGLIPAAVENETSSTMRLIGTVAEILPEEQKHPNLRIYINFGESSTSVYLFDMETTMPIQVHNFSVGHSIFFKDIKANVSLNDEQVNELIEKVGFTQAQSSVNVAAILGSPFNEFVSEMKRFMVSSKSISNKSIDDIMIFGEGSKFAGFSAMLTKMLGVQVNTMNLEGSFETNAVSDYFKEDWSIFVPAVGAALR